MSDKPIIYYEVDPSKNPAMWPGVDISSKIAVSKVDVIFININAASDFRILRTGTNEDNHHALAQVAKHVAHGLYRLVSLNITEYSCVVVFSTEKMRSELMWKNGFPWDREEKPNEEAALKQEVEESHEEVR